MLSPSTIDQDTLLKLSNTDTEIKAYPKDFVLTRRARAFFWGETGVLYERVETLYRNSL